METQNEKFVTICIPIYNTKPSLIKRCLKSAINCGLDKSEFVIAICNDGSTKDDTKETIKTEVSKYRKQGYTINEHIHIKNLSLLEARKTMVFNAKSKFIYNLDCDDTILKDSFKKVKKILIERNLEKYDIIATGFNEIAKIQSLTHHKNFEFIGKSLLKTFIIDKAFSGYVWGKFINTEKYKRAISKLPVTYVNFTEDILQIVYISLECNSFACIEDDCKTYNYFRTNESITSSSSKIKITKFKWESLLSYKYTYIYLNPKNFSNEEIQNKIVKIHNKFLTELFSLLVIGNFDFDKKEAEKMFIDLFGLELTQKLNESFKNVSKNKK